MICKLPCLFLNSTVDFNPPIVLQCPSDITEFLERGEGDFLSITWSPEPFANDINPPVTSNTTNNPGDLFSVGTTTVTYTFYDRFENIATCSFDVNIILSMWFLHLFLIEILTSLFMLVISILAYKNRVSSE